jgi:Ca-activated chloride channel homolog
MKKRNYLLCLLVLALMSMSCSLLGENGPPRNALVFRVAAAPALERWLSEAAESFNREKIKTEAGQVLYVEVDLIEAGDFVADAANVTVYALWIPDQAVWVDVMAQDGYQGYAENCLSLVESPLVIAMWQPLAEALGWPGKDLGWLDLGSLAADPSAWTYYSGGQFGENFRMGHAHPGLSASGTATLLAVVQAAQSKSEAVTAEEISAPIVQASVSAFEGSVASFTKTASELITLMAERGQQYLNASITYENLITTYEGDIPLVPIYPFEGTFVADFPACVNGEMSADKIAAAEAFRGHLLLEETQQQAWENGLRPLDMAIIEDAAAQPLIDLQQPSVVFESPSVDAVFAVQDLWKSARKAVNLAMVIDTSGSMEGRKLINVKSAASDLISVMGDEDYVTILIYDQLSKVEIPVEHAKVGENRQALINLINNLTAWSGTPLYDSIAVAAESLARTQSASTANAMVVLTDGLDTESFNYRFNETLINLAMANDTTVYTIAYGNDADENLLEELALQANGNFYQADEANIAEIYGEMSILFGGNLGIGR